MHFSDDAGLAEFLDAFERGVFPIAEWKHAQHITMAVCYLDRMSVAEAVPVLRANISAYNVAQGGENTDAGGYHETLTVLWAALVKQFLEALPPGIALHEKANRAVEQFAPRRDCFREYYSYDVVKSLEARREWKAPDLKPISY